MAAAVPGKARLQLVPAREMTRTRKSLPANVVELDAWAIDRGYKDEMAVEVAAELARGHAEVLAALESLRRR